MATDKPRGWSPLDQEAFERKERRYAPVAERQREIEERLTDTRRMDMGSGNAAWIARLTEKLGGGLGAR